MKWSALLLALCGCAVKKPTHVVTIPQKCIKVRITDFTKPCKTLGPDTAVCDGVKITYECVQYSR